MWIILVITLFSFLTLLLLRRSLFLSRKGFWKKYGIPEIDASSIVSELDILLGRKDITERDDYIYKTLENENLKFCGVVENPTPIILVKDLEIIKKILIKDFDHFVDRRQFFGAAREDSVLRKMLGNLQGEEWKGVRSSVRPTFTTGKIRRMMDCFNSVCLDWMKQLSMNSIKANDEKILKINVFNCVRNYTVDVIASAIFGLQADTIQNPNSKFSLMANRLIDMSTFQIIKFTLSYRLRKLYQFFNIDILDMEALRFFEAILKSKLKKRMDGEEKRNDFLQLLVEARKGVLEKTQADELSAFEKEAQIVLEKMDQKKFNNHQFLTDHVMNGQCLSFFFAGFRTTSHFITFAMYALALNPEVQEKLRAEVEGIFKEDGSLDYDDLGQLVYLDMVVCEILRMFPATLRLERTCVSEYNDPETGLHVPKGTIVGIPLRSIHYDKKYYETPDKFNPEHFRPETKAARSPYAFMAFGAGPRNCIGMRFALVKSKAAIVQLVHNFIIKPTDKTPVQLTGRRVHYQITPPADLELALVPRR